jgi:hypothetical protein
MDASAKKTLHPDAARLSHKRSRYDVREEHKVSRDRSTSRHEEMKEQDDFKLAVLQRKYKEKQKKENGEWVKKDIRQRRRRRRQDFCHECNEPRVFSELLCAECGHERCFLCWVALGD